MSLRHAIQNLRGRTVDEEICTSHITSSNGLCNAEVQPSNSLCAIGTFEDINFSDEETDEFYSGVSLSPPPQLPTPISQAVDKSFETLDKTPRLTTPITSSSSENCLTYTSKSYHSTSKAGSTFHNAIRRSPLKSSHPPTTPLFNLPVTPSASTPVTSIQCNDTTRRFPGPAGCLPRLSSRQDISNIKVVSSSAKPSPLATPRRKRMTASVTDPTQTTASREEFTTPPWTLMMKELDMTHPSSMHLTQYTIANTIRLANSHQLINGKVPFLRVLVKMVSSNAKNMSVLVRDETGEMLSTVHMRVWDEYRDSWGPGCCLVLRQVSVFSPAPRKHYLNITLGNIVRLYPAAAATEEESVRRIKLMDDILSEDPRPIGNIIRPSSISRPSTCNILRPPNNTVPSLAANNRHTTPSELMDSAVLSRQDLTRLPAATPTGCLPNADDDLDALFDDIDILSFDI